VDAERELRDRAVAGDPAAVRELIKRLLPVVQVRVARILSRRRKHGARDIRQEVEDFAQEVFVALFENDGRVLRAWDPLRGTSLASFCGIIAERESVSILRSGRRSPWTEDATSSEDLENALGGTADAEIGLMSRDQLRRLAERLTAELSPQGLLLFQRLVIEDESVESICASMQMTPAAVYAWRSRLGKLARRLAHEITSSDPEIVAGARQMSGPDGVDRSDDVAERERARAGRSTHRTRGTA
jgi:RNA polymerase sigma-70 factor (ECF subfamily)